MPGAEEDDVMGLELGEDVGLGVGVEREIGRAGVL